MKNAEKEESKISNNLGVNIARLPHYFAVTVDIIRFSSNSHPFRLAIDFHYIPYPSVNKWLATGII